VDFVTLYAIGHYCKKCVIKVVKVLSTAGTLCKCSTGREFHNYREEQTMTNLRNKLVIAGSLAAAMLMGSQAQAQSTAPDFDPVSGVLTLPEVKAGATTYYYARMKFDGSSNFTLLSVTTNKPGDVPPLTAAAATREWLATGFYKTWKCEAAAHPATGNSPHGTVRVCTNPLLSAASAAPWPVGSTSVKEIYTNGAVSGYSMSVKVKEGEGADTWHWYSQNGANTGANAVGVAGCNACHAAATDRVFIRTK
jgi:hypothetical protein